LALTWSVFDLVFPEAAACRQVPTPGLAGRRCELWLSPETELRLLDNRIRIGVPPPVTVVKAQGWICIHVQVPFQQATINLGYKLSQTCWATGTVGTDGKLTSFQGVMPESYVTPAGRSWGKVSGDERTRYVAFLREIWPRFEAQRDWDGLEEWSDFSSLPLQV